MAVRCEGVAEVAEMAAHGAYATKIIRIKISKINAKMIFLLLRKRHTDNASSYSVWTVSQANKSVTGSKTRVTCHKFLCDMSQNFFPAARQTSGPAAESAPFGGLTRSGALALARCARL